MVSEEAGGRTGSPDTHHLFVYGTLREAAYHPMHAELRRDASLLGRGLFHGLLFDLGHYPGGVHSSATENTVTGEVYAVQQRRSGAVFEALDAYEGCHVENRKAQFRREIVTVSLVDGRSIQAWVYLYTGLIRGQPIPGGDYIRYKGLA